MHPSYLGFQIDWPVFVKIPFKTGKKQWQRTEHFNWAELGYEAKDVAALYNNNYIYHNEELEKTQEVGYRLAEFSKPELRTIVEQMNLVVKDRTDSKEQFQKIRCRQSASMEKQRGLIRRFLHNNPSFEEDYYKIIDYVIGKRPKPITTKVEAPEE